MVSGFQQRFVEALMWAWFLGRLLRRYPNPVHTVRALRCLVGRLGVLRGGRAARKFVRVEGRYYSHPYVPGWPSRSFDRFVDTELDRLTLRGNVPHHRVGLQTVFLAITKACPLRCRHCYEWEALNGRETTSLDDLRVVVDRFQELGVTQIRLSGGEPLQRMGAIVDLVRRARPGTDFWILTSGMGLAPERARTLKEAGLTGINLSLDHWDGREHDAFRGRDASFDWVQRAARSAKDAGLVLALSLCPTRDFVGKENLRRYVELATKLGADFIQILEPRAVGHFTGEDVTLRAGEQAILERFHDEMNFDPRNDHRALVFYPELAQRRRGCHGAGLRYLYVDADLRIHACPFCRNDVGSALDSDLEDRIVTLRRQGCGTPEMRKESLGSAA
jgi:MoaA/NifB/PqqE/SkfB family radical SAM enzyme